MKHGWRQLGLLECLPHQLEAPRAISHMQVYDSGLSRHQTSHVSIAGDSHQLVHSDNEIDMDDVVAYTAGDGDWRNMVSPSMAVGAQSLSDEATGSGHELGRRSHGVVGAEYANDGGDAAGRDPTELKGRHPG